MESAAATPIFVHHCLGGALPGSFLLTGSHARMLQLCLLEDIAHASKTHAHGNIPLRGFEYADAKGSERKLWAQRKNKTTLVDTPVKLKGSSFDAAAGQVRLSAAASRVWAAERFRWL